MNTENSIQINEPGLYLFGSPKKISVSLKGLLVFTLHSPSSSFTGLVVQSPEEHRGDLLYKLDTLWKKYSTLSDVDANSIQGKIFGEGDKFTSLLLTLKGWLARHKIPVLASNVGKLLPDNLVVDCGSGKVGIQYLKSDLSPSSYLISSGTARLRNDSYPIKAEVIILSSNRVTRTLAKQCVEEQPQWSATAPELFNDAFLKKLKEENRWSVALVFDDLESNPHLSQWIQNLAAFSPSVQFRWIGAQIPYELKSIGDFKQLPPLEPVLIPEFKKSLARAVFDSELSSTSETWNFSKKKRAK